MNVIRHDWWATPVWEVDTGFNTKFNDALLEEIAKCNSPINPFEFNIWDYKSPCISAVKEKILTCAKENTVQQLPPFLRSNMILTRGWVNRQQPGESLGLHYHAGTLMACTYYINSPENCGDLMLVEPRGGVNWGWEQDGNVFGAKFKRIKPKEGKLVMFPAFVLHMVDINRSDQTRVSLATNISTISVNNK